MSKEWTRLEEKNDFLGSTNQLAAAASNLMYQIGMLTDFEIQLPNIGTSYQRKILELESAFQEHSLDYFEKGNADARLIIDFDLLGHVTHATDILERKLIRLQSFFLLNQISFLKVVSNKIIGWFLKDYVREVEYVEAYNMESDFAKSVMRWLYKAPIDSYTENCYVEVWGAGKTTLEAFGLQEQVSAIETEALRIVTKQEQAGLEYLKKGI